MPGEIHCPLYAGAEISFYSKDRRRSYLSCSTCGLDFGCGRGPALAHMLRDAEFNVALYDSFFVPEEDVLDARYDFICVTEVVEHLYPAGTRTGAIMGAAAAWWALQHGANLEIIGTDVILLRREP